MKVWKLTREDNDNKEIHKRECNDNKEIHKR